MERIKIKGRIHTTLTRAQTRRMNEVRKLIAAELPDLIRRNHLADAAMKEKTFSGRLRRAVHEFPQSSRTIAQKAEIRWIDLDDFLTGEQTLPSDAIDRLVKVLKLKLPLSKARGAAKAS